MAFVLNIKGLDKTLKKIKDVQKELLVEISGELEQGAQNIAAKAEVRAPVDKGSLQMNIKWEKDPAIPMTYYVYAKNKYAPYVEFGTGKFVFMGQFWVDAQLERYARTFYVNGKGRMYPRPFFFNSYFEEKPEMIKRVKKVLELKK